MAEAKVRRSFSDISPKFIGLFGFCCIYIFLRAKGAFSIGPTLSLSLIFPFLAIFLFLPVAVHITFRRGGVTRAARFAFWTGYSWMGFMLLFLFVTISVDIAAFLLGTASALAGPAQFMPAGKMDKFILSLILSLGLSAYALCEAAIPGIKMIELETEKLPRDIESLRVVHISDVHLGPVVGKRRAERIARKIVKAEPDILVLTGDLIDSRPSYLGGMEKIFGDITVPLGKYAVLGNHEVAAGLSGSLRFLQEAGFRVLRNETVFPGNAIRISGADDAAAGRRKFHPKNPGFPGESGCNLFGLYLKHRPPFDSRGDDVAFDLQLSGHTHGGQLFPFRYVTLGYYPKLRGLYTLPTGKLLYVNSGAGTWGPPMRFLTPPEITVIDLIRTSSRAA